MKRHAKYKRLSPIIEFLKKEAVKNKATVHELLSVLRQLDYHHGDRRASSSSISEKLAADETINIMPMLPTLYLFRGLPAFMEKDKIIISKLTRQIFGFSGYFNGLFWGHTDL